MPVFACACRTPGDKPPRNNGRRRREHGSRSSVCGTDGGYLTFGYSGTTLQTATVNAIYHVTNANPNIPDGTGSVGLQPGYPTVAFNDLNEYFLTGGPVALDYDTDGHATAWILDGSGRPTQTQHCTVTQGSPTTGMTCPGVLLLTNDTWDANNDLVAEVGPRGYESDYAYDVEGNLIVATEPAVTTSQGTFRPSRVYSYDSYNNVTAYCDEIATNALGGDGTYTGPPSDSLCPSDKLTTQISYVYPAYEPYGEISAITSPATAAAPSGYQRTYSYSASQQGGADYGLPTSEVGQLITQPDGTTRLPTQNFWYDANGDIACYSQGNGDWVLTYDALNRLISMADPDDSAAGSGTCGKTGGQSGWSTANTKTYYPDGSVATLQVPSGRQVGMSTSYTYDLDGDEISDTHHYGCTSATSCAPGVTTKWYDGADRLVEVEEPQDPSDFYTYPWLERYIYDLSGNGTDSFGTYTSFRAHGNLAKRQQYVGSDPAWWTSTGWTDTTGTAYDDLDRVTANLTVTPTQETAFGNVYSAQTVGFAESTKTYDTNGNAGLLSSWTNAVGDSDALVYDARGELLSDTFSGSDYTPNRSYGYDADGRVTTLTSAALGTYTRSYDGAGELVSTAEPPQSGNPIAGGFSGVTDPVTLNYGYYADGMKATLAVTPNGGPAIPGMPVGPLKQYTYRQDGLVSSATYAFNGSVYPFSWSYTSGGRVTSRSDVLNNPAYQYTYDNSGRVASYTTPLFSQSNIAYDAEAEISSYAGFRTTAKLTYSTRGELVGQSFASDTCGAGPANNPAGNSYPLAWFQKQSANGVLVNLALCYQAPVYAAPMVFDHNLGVLFGSGSGYAGQQRHFDVDGRNVSVLRWWDDVNSGLNHFFNDTRTRSLDAENHVSGDTYTSYPAPPLDNPTNTSYVWDPSGHIAVSGGDYLGADPVPGTTSNTWYYTTYHWDGNQPLFESSTNPEFGPPFFFTDTFGTAGNYYNGSTFAPYFAVGDLDVTGTYEEGGRNTISASYPVTAPVAVPYVATAVSDGLETFEGTRTIDAGGTQQWNEPDPYSGEVGDPLSEQPYMWDRNNPIAYSDPTGFDASCPTPNSSGQASSGLQTIGCTSTTAPSRPPIIVGGPGTGAQVADVTTMATMLLRNAAVAGCALVQRHCHNVLVKFSSQNGVDHGMSCKPGDRGYIPPTVSQDEMRTGVKNDLMARLWTNQLKPGEANVKFTFTMNGMTFGYTANYSSSASVISVPTYYVSEY
jgi:YD repeat-containing protein